MLKLLKAGAVVVVLAAAAATANHFLDRNQREWNERVEREVDRAEAALEDGRRAKIAARVAEQRADSLALLAAKVDTVIVEQIRNLPAPPPECEEFTAPRDLVIQNMQKRYVLMWDALDKQRTATALLRIAEEKARLSADSLLAVLESRPKPLSPLVPKVGLGVTAGICTNAKPCIAGGVTLQWEVDLF